MTLYFQTLVQKANRGQTSNKQTAEIVTVQNIHTPSSVMFLSSSVSAAAEIHQGQPETLSILEKGVGEVEEGTGKDTRHT